MSLVQDKLVLLHVPMVNEYCSLVLSGREFEYCTL